LRYLITAFAFVGIGLLILLAKSLANSDLISSESFRLLLIFNVIFIIGLVLLIGIQIYRLFRNIKKEIVGSKLTLRLVLSFGLMVIIPVSVVYFVSFNFLTKSIDSWFNVKVESALEGGLSLGQKTLDILMKDIELKSKSIAFSLGNTDENQRNNQLIDLREKFAIFQAIIIDNKNNIIAISSENIANIPQLPPADDLIKAEGSFYGRILDDNGKIFLKSLSPIKFKEDITKKVYLELTQPIPLAISNLAISVESVYEEYQQLAYSRTSLKIIYSLTLTLVLLLAILSAVALSFLISRRFSSPIAQLAEATVAVAKGNFKKVIPDQGKKDELGMLVNSFNSMTAQLNSATLSSEKNRIKVEEARKFLDSILTNLSSGIIVIKKNLEIIQTNIEFYKIFNLAVKRQFRNLNDFCHINDEYLKLIHFVSEFVKEKKYVKTKSKDFKFNINKNEKIIRLQIKSIKESGEFIFILLIDDITDVSAAQRHQAWSEVARRLAHEIKNPLTPIQLSAERVESKLKDKLSVEDLQMLHRSTQTIVNQVESLKIMVNEFADYARTPKLKKEDIDINEFIQEILDLYESSKVLIKYDNVKGSLIVSLDKNKLRQVFINLIENSIDALESTKKPLIYISVIKRMKTLIFKISDNGPGVPSELINRVFEPYVTSKTKGTGLGLAIVYKIIDEHNGDIKILNDKKGGTLVTFKIPIES
jgi:nitrogen fixation/metabolism regulation signal transduction histidine kinase